MTHRCHRPVPARRIFAALDSDYGPYRGEEGDPRNDDRDANEIYEDEVNAARFAEQMRIARMKQAHDGEQR
jgi:hypothetical protein